MPIYRVRVEYSFFDSLEWELEADTKDEAIMFALRDPYEFDVSRSELEKEVVEIEESVSEESDDEN